MIRDWRHKLTSASRSLATVTLSTPLTSSQGGSGAFLAIAEDGNKYWVKPANNPQGIKTLAAEVVIAGVGEALGAPVRPISLISIPPELQSWKYKNHLSLSSDIAHGSLDLGKSLVSIGWDHTAEDHNSHRQAFIYVLWDLCMGGDPQWLHDITDEYSIWSFDHGFWFGGDGEWDSASLLLMADRSWQYDLDLENMSADGLRAAALAVRSLSDDEILASLSDVPIDWSISLDDLATLGGVLSHRREQVALRAEQLALRVFYP